MIIFVLFVLISSLRRKCQYIYSYYYTISLCQIFLYFNDLYFKIRLCKPILRLRGLAWAGAVALFLLLDIEGDDGFGILGSRVTT